MGTFFGVLVGFVLGLVLAGAAFIDIVSTDNERGYQPNKPLDGPASQASIPPSEAVTNMMPKILVNH